MKIFCDLDGTLIDVAPRHYRVYTESVVMFGGIPISFSKYWDLKRKKTKWPIILELSGLSQSIEKKFLNHFILKIEDLGYLYTDELFDGAREVLHYLSMHHDLFLVSLRRNEENLLKELEHINIHHLFKKVLSGHSESDGYDKKIELISNVIGNDRGLIIGDTEADIITGKKLKLTTAAVTSGIRDEVFLSGLDPDYLLSNFIEVRKLSLG